MIRGLIKKEIEKAILATIKSYDKSYQKEKWKSEDLKKQVKKFIIVECSNKNSFGDYNSNAALVFKYSHWEEDSLKLAGDIEKELLKLKKFNELISKTEIAGPGFLNLTLSEKGLEAGLSFISDSKQMLGFWKKKIGKGKKIQVEFISANPTGELHIGHGRSAFYGDALSNILKEAGYKVEKEFYINDSKESVQIKGLIFTAFRIKKENISSPIKKEKIPYDSEYLREILNSNKIYYKNVADEIQRHNQEFITNILGIKFDKWFSEEKELRKKTAF
ncbi:MAG: arginine--tRNA ligase, partial [Nanoarchaeota archaeon]